MKTILLILLLIFTNTIYSAPSQTEINWNNYSFDSFTQAKKLNLTVLLFAESSSCEWCTKMKSTTLKDPAVIKLISDNYYPVILDVDKNYIIADKYNIDNLPTFIFFDANENPTTMLSGYMNSDLMKVQLNKMIKLKGNK